MNLISMGVAAAELGMVPDSVVRSAVRLLCQVRRRGESREGPNGSLDSFRESLRSGPIAIAPEMANRQHYELPPEFFAGVLGPRQKYSCCYFPREDSTLAEAEEAALEATCERAGLADGQEVLELGCGWGSLSLWAAERYPGSRITAVSNSRLQQRWVSARAEALGLANLQPIVADMNDFQPEGRTFDRIVSVEMFEHMRNYHRLLQRIATWLRPTGRVFVHVFCHRRLCYPFGAEGASNWMGRHFFTGGMMPSADLLREFDRDLTVAEQYAWSGRHYQKTAEAWLANLDANRERMQSILESVHGAAEARRWFHRWRMFFIAVSEVFGFNDGEDWFVSQYELRRAQAP